MMYFIEIIGLFLVIGIAVTFISNTLNRDIRRLEGKAENIVRTRISNRKVKKKLFFLNLQLFSNEDVIKIRYLLKQLSILIGVESLESKLRDDDVLHDLFRVKKNELLEFDKTWKKVGLNDYIEVFSNELLTALNSVLGKSGVNCFIKDLGVENDDDKVLYLIMAMTVKDFLNIVIKYHGVSQ